VAFTADLPACGYASYAVEPHDGPSHCVQLVLGDSHSLENENLRVEVGPHGHLTLIDKSSQRSFSGLHKIENTTDRGDCYDFCPLPGSDGDGVILEGEPATEILAGGCLAKSLAIRSRFQVPESLVDSGRIRSSEYVDLPVTTVLKLKAGSRHLEIVTELDNRTRDHRLRVLFPTGIDSDILHADGHFALTSRRATSAEAEDWHQLPSSAQPHHTWFGTDDGEYGLAVLSEGLPEHAGHQDPYGLTLALTLLRGVGWLSRGDLCTRQGHSGPVRRTPEAQCLGRHTFRYGLLPYSGDPVAADVAHGAGAFDAQPLVKVTEPCGGMLPPWHSMVSLEPGSVILTALKRSDADSRLLVRFYSLAQSVINATVRFGFRVSEIHRATAAERIIKPLDLSADRTECKLPVESGEIVTLLLRPEQPLGPIEIVERDMLK
jgi:mannosylglycerate hydrolase